MTIDEKYMRRCLQLARKGEGSVKPNPIVGAVVVHDGKIIGEGYHREYGHAHAEVNAINSVTDASLFAESTLYVSLEPCSHFGKTPPCAALIISKKIPRVVVACLDPNPLVSGNGIRMMREAGIEVVIGVLQQEAEEINRPFFVNQLYKRPYFVLKWAQSADGFMDVHRQSFAENPPAQISNDITQTLVHKFRTEVQGIMVGTNTAVLDNPHLTARKWYGKNPVRIILDREGRIPATANIFNGEAKTIVFTQMDNYPVVKSDVKAVKIDFSKNVIKQISDALYNGKILSVMVEGGAQLLTSFIDTGFWDEAFVEVSDKELKAGVKAPRLSSKKMTEKRYLDSIQFHLKNEITRNFL